MKIHTHDLGGGASETSVHSDAGALVAVVTHPLRGAKWFLHRADRYSSRGEPFRTLKAALEAVLAANRYRTTLRPIFGGGVPPGVPWELVEAPSDGSVNRPDLPVSRHRFGVFRTERPLTAEELQHFDIVVA